MANTYTQIHLQFVFVTKFRSSFINPIWEDELYKYITGIVQNNHHKMLCINGMSDHIHMLVGFRPSQSISEFMKDVKANSSKWINANKLTPTRFQWQSGYGAFSYSKSHIPRVISYINNQKKHHQKTTFLEEYKTFLEKFQVEYYENYIFHEPN